MIDTSVTSVYELADMIRERVDRRRTSSLSGLIESFGGEVVPERPEVAPLLRPVGERR